MNIVTRILHLHPLRVAFSRSLQTQKVSNILPVFTQFPNASNCWIYQQNDQIISPINRITKIDLPNGLKWVPPLNEPSTKEISIEVPSSNVNDAPLEAARLIVIRRKKMKKHKLRKLRKRMKFEWAKRRQRRELRKEKTFQAKLIQQYTEAEAFSAEQYVKERISKYNELIRSKNFTPKLNEYVNELSKK